MQLAGTKQGIRFPMCRNLSSCTGEIYIIIPTQYPPSKEKVMCVEMAYCTNCGKEIASTSKFCSACGKENAEYNPNGNKSSQEYDVIVTPKIRLAGPQDAKTETYVFVPQLGKNMRILFPNFMELGQTIRVRGEGLYKPNGDRGDLLVTPSEIEYYDTEMTISAKLIGASDAVTKMDDTNLSLTPERKIRSRFILKKKPTKKSTQRSYGLTAVNRHTSGIASVLRMIHTIR